MDDKPAMASGVKRAGEPDFICLDLTRTIFVWMPGGRLSRQAVTLAGCRWDQRLVTTLGLLAMERGATAMELTASVECGISDESSVISVEAVCIASVISVPGKRDTGWDSTRKSARMPFASHYANWRGISHTLASFSSENGATTTAHASEGSYLSQMAGEASLAATERRRAVHRLQIMFFRSHTWSIFPSFSVG